MGWAVLPTPADHDNDDHDNDDNNDDRRAHHHDNNINDDHNIDNIHNIDDDVNCRADDNDDNDGRASDELATYAQIAQSLGYQMPARRAITRKPRKLLQTHGQ